MDDVDRVTERQGFTEELARKKRANIIKNTSSHCIECDIKISKDRQKATGGTEYCVDCLSMLE